MKTVAEIQEETGYRDAPDCDELKHIPGKYGLPFLGRGLSAYFNLPRLVKEHYENWGEISRIQFGDQKGIFLLGADHIQEVLLDRTQNWSTEKGYEKTMRHFLDGGLLGFDFDEHKIQRRILQTCFKYEVMRTYTAEVNRILAEQMSQWDTSKTLSFYPEIKDVLLRIGTKIFIGIENNEADYDELNRAFIHLQGGFNDQFKKEIPGTPFYRGKKGVRFLREYFMKIVPERRKSKGTDMLTLMCKEAKEDGSLYSDREISDHATFILFAAHDTTTSVLNHLVYYFGKHQEWQERARSVSVELNKPFLDFDDLDKMTLLDNAFRECMRLHPPLPLLVRRNIREVEFLNYRVPPNTLVFIPASYNHTSDKYWINPEVFDPDRFLAERNEHKGHAFAYFPFGGGAHKCIGMHFAQMLGKTFMHQLLLNYSYRLPDGFKVKFQYVPLPKPAKLPLVLTKL